MAFKKTTLKILKWIGIVIGTLFCLSITVALLFIGFMFLYWSNDYEKTEVFKVTGNYQLSYFSNKKSMTLYYNYKEEYGGSKVIDETVYQVDWNDEWIIAKQHPNLEEPIQDRLFNYSEKTGDYELTDPNDTIYLLEGDRKYEKDGKWFHTKNKWTQPDSLYPYRKKTNYYIIKVNSTERIIFNADTEDRLAELRDSLKIPHKLNHHLIFKGLK
jgi:hypothetical protein